MKNLVKLILFCCSVGHLSASGINDSTKSFSIIGGTYNFSFNKIITSAATRTVFFNNTISPYQNPAIGFKLGIPVTERKRISLEMLYSHAMIGYHYSSPYSGNNNFGTTGYIQIDGLIFNTVMQYKVFNWLKLNYGLGHHLNFSNHFDSLDIAE